MKKLIGKLLLGLLVLFMSTTIFSKTRPTNKFVTIGTGGVVGVYYSTGGTIARLMNKGRKTHGIRTSVESTGGSVYNINTLMESQLDFALAQQDVVHQAINRIGKFEGVGQDKKLRSVFSLHTEMMTLVVSEKSGINSIADLKGKRLNIGNFGSGNKVDIEELLKISSISEEDLALASKLIASEAPKALVGDKIDAYFYTVGHPNKVVQETFNGGFKGKIIPITGPEVDALVARAPYYSKDKIDVSFYKGDFGSGDIETIGVKANLISSSDVDEDVVYEVTKSVFENIDYLKKKSPVFADLTEKGMVEGLSAPIHKGALRYYREVGLDKYIDPELMK